MVYAESNRVYGVALSGDGQVVLVGGRNKTAVLYEARQTRARGGGKAGLLTDTRANRAFDREYPCTWTLSFDARAGFACVYGANRESTNRARLTVSSRAAGIAIATLVCDRTRPRPQVNPPRALWKCECSDVIYAVALSTDASLCALGGQFGAVRGAARQHARTRPLCGTRKQVARRQAKGCMHVRTKAHTLVRTHALACARMRAHTVTLAVTAHALTPLRLHNDARACTHART
eukprot:6195611-Pleurochrysis_carterae.AAC.1